MVHNTWVSVEYIFTGLDKEGKPVMHTEVVKDDDELIALENSDLFTKFTSWKTYRTKKCSVCGNLITCNNFTNTCFCGTDYNSAGQKLADRSQWGEETGEHPSDCY